MKYIIDCHNTAAHILQITLEATQIDTPSVDLQLPVWRPGRYELANYAKNMFTVRCFTSDGLLLDVEKVNRHRWRVHMNGHTTLVVQYEYYAYQMDAGNSWLDANLVYINFINCLFYLEGRIDDPCELNLKLPKEYKIACGLPQIQELVFTASDFYQLVDSPLIASATLQQHTYTVGDVPFHLWVQGEAGVLDWEKVLFDFQRFTEVQMQMMGDFPQTDYHFLLILLPEQHYHGVEHRNSTVMTLGPASQIADELYPELMGLASHELFHAWNICAIRPQELLPYDFTRENYFTTGYVAEGVTTYYGDLFLARSGFFDSERYYSELTRTLNRHFINSNAAQLSLLESSFDLWIDGYTAGTPNRKVSIYHKGALVALILDMEIRKATSNAKSLDDVMRGMWQRFGKTGIGYTHNDYIALAEEVSGVSLQDYVTDCLTGTVALQSRLDKALQYINSHLRVYSIAEKSGCVQIEFIALGESLPRDKWLGNKT